MFGYLLRADVWLLRAITAVYAALAFAAVRLLSRERRCQPVGFLYISE